MEEDMKKFIIFLCAILVIGGGVLVVKKFIPKQEEQTPNYSEIYEVGDLPLTVDLVPLSYKIEEVDGKKVLKVSYTNNSTEAIMAFSVDLKLKSDQEPVNVKFSQLLQTGETSSAMEVNISDDIKVEDIQAVKYMISLQKGVYMEYDATTRQYNWS